MVTLNNKIKLNKLEITIIILLSILIISIAIPIISGKDLIIDKLAYTFLVEKLRKYQLDGFMKIVTSFSNTTTIVGFTIILTLAFLLEFKNKKEALAIPINVIGITLINQAIKHIIKRPRPTGFRLIKQGGYSFPSGHAMVSMAFYGLIIYIINRKIKNNKLKVFLTTICVLVIISIGISRVYLGVHYLSDVLTGYSLSIIYLIITTKILDKYKLFP